MEFGDKLLSILNEREISQKDFAALLNIAPTTLNGYIKNKRQPDFALVKRIAFSLNVSIDYLLDYNNSSLDLDIAELSLIDKLRKMDFKERKVVYDLVNLIDKSREEK
ncbi:MAG: helix-turn-helix domain-containing protein [Oscillospiraceae bacterium]